MIAEAAWEKQLEHYRRMTGGQRPRIALDSISASFR
jgi:hypothetical protein